MATAPLPGDLEIPVPPPPRGEIKLLLKMQNFTQTRDAKLEDWLLSILRQLLHVKLTISPHMTKDEVLKLAETSFPDCICEDWKKKENWRFWVRAVADDGTRIWKSASLSDTYPYLPLAIASAEGDQLYESLITCTLGPLPQGHTVKRMVKRIWGNREQYYFVKKEVQGGYREPEAAEFEDGIIGHQDFLICNESKDEFPDPQREI